MMKIAFIVNQFPSLTETFILNQVVGLLNNGHEIQIYAHSLNSEDSIHPDIKKYQLMSKCYSMGYPYNKLIRILLAGGLFFANIHKDPCKVLRALNFFRYGVSALSLKRFYYLLPFLGANFDIIHCHFGTNGAIGVLLSEMGVQGKIVTTFYGVDMSALPKIEKWRVVYDKLFRIGDLFLVEGSHMREELIKIGCPPEKAKIQHIMVDDQRIFSQTRKAKTTDERLIMLHCGRFVEKKGLIFALRALEILLPRFPNLEIRVIGDGGLRAEIEQFVESHDLKQNVVLLGNQPHSVFVAELKNADILVQPSITAANGDSEGGAPTVLIEAQAAGVPVIGTYHADIPEVIKDGKTGLLARERDVLDLAEKMEQLITTPELRQTMGQEGRKHVAMEYSIFGEVKNLENHYRHIVSGNC